MNMNNFYVAEIARLKKLFKDLLLMVMDGANCLQQIYPKEHFTILLKINLCLEEMQKWFFGLVGSTRT